MKGKTLIELLTLSSNLYMIAKDKEVMDQLKKWADKGKDKLNHLMEDTGDESDGTAFLQKITDKAKEARHELEQRMEQVAVKAYKKMHIAHTDDLKSVLTSIETLEKKFNLLEARILNQEKQSPR